MTSEQSIGVCAFAASPTRTRLIFLVNTLGHHKPPISIFCSWCNTRPLCGCQDSCRSCVRPHLRTGACGVSVKPSPGNLFQTLFCQPHPCSLFHYQSDNLRRQGGKITHLLHFLINFQNAVLGGSVQMITILHRGGSGQMITVLHTPYVIL